jgi:ABC-2 type transport system permease protein
VSGVEAGVASVTGTFLRMKLALLRNGMRQSAGRSASFVGTLVASALFGALGLLSLVALRGHEHGTDTALALIALITLVWAFVPLFVGGVDETLDPGRLAMLPLRPRQLLPAQLAASLVGPGPLFTLLLLAGAVTTAARGAAGVITAVVAVPLVLLTCTTLARALATANARLLSSRRGRDLAVLSGIVVALGIQLVNLGVSSLTSEDGGFGPVETLADVVGLLPPASAVDAVRAAGDGAYAVAARGLGAALALLGLLLVWWWRTLTRLMTAPDSSSLGASSEPTGARRSTGAEWLPTGRTGTVMLRALRYAWRDPKAKMGWTMAIVMGLLLPVIFAVQGNVSVYHACWVAGLLGLLMYNQFGQDYSGFWLVAQTISSPRDAFVELRGRALAIGLIGVPFTAAAVLLTAALSGDWAGLPDALGLTLALLGASVGTGAVASARFPYSIPQDNAMKNVAPGQSGLAWAGILGGMLATAALCAPVIALAVWLNTAGTAWAALVLPAGAGWGLLLAWAGLRMAAPWTAARLPEILSAVSRA